MTMNMVTLVCLSTLAGLYQDQMLLTELTFHQIARIPQKRPASWIPCEDVVTFSFSGVCHEISRARLKF